MSRTLIMILAGLGLFIVLTVVVIMSSGGSSDSDYDENFMEMDHKESFTMEDMMAQEENEIMFNTKDDELVKIEDEESSIDNLFSDTAETESFYSNEDKQFIKDLESQIGQKNSSSNTTRYDGYMPKQSNSPTGRTMTDVFNEKKRRNNLGGINNQQPTYQNQTQNTAQNQVITQQVQPVRRRINTDELSNRTASSSAFGSNSIPTKIYENKTVKTGSNIKLITTKATNFQGTTIPVNTIITGIVQFDRDRITINVNTIKLRSQNILCSLTAYSDNGLKGLTISGNNLKKEVANDATNQGGTYIKTPIGSIGTDAFQKSLNDNSVLVYDNTPLILK